MITVKDQVSMMWGREVAESLDDAGLLRGEGDGSALYYKSAITHYVVQIRIPYDLINKAIPYPHSAITRTGMPGHLVIPDKYSYSLDRDVKEWLGTWVRVLNGYTSMPLKLERVYTKAWPAKSKGQASRTCTGVKNWGLKYGIEATLHTGHLLLTGQVPN